MPGSGWLHELKAAAVAVVAVAVLGMMRTLTPDRERAMIAALATIAMLAVPSALAQVLVIVLGGVAGALHQAMMSCRSRWGAARARYR
jgi:chromate transporter